MVPLFSARQLPEKPGQTRKHLKACEKCRKGVRQPNLSCYHARRRGKMPEWPNGTDSKSVVYASAPRVRIPIFPPYSILIKPLNIFKISGAFSFQRLRLVPK